MDMVFMLSIYSIQRHIKDRGGTASETRYDKTHLKLRRAHQ